MRREPAGAEGVMWNALLANLDEKDREQAQQRVWESIEADRSRARVAPPDDPLDEAGDDDADDEHL